VIVRRRRRRGITTHERFDPHDVCAPRTPSPESTRARAICIIRARALPPAPARPLAKRAISQPARKNDRARFSPTIVRCNRRAASKTTL